MAKHEINVQTLYDLVELKRKVDPWDVASACQGIYYSIKVVGVQRTIVKYTEEDGTEMVMSADCMSMKILAVAALGAKMFYRFQDDTGRLETHYGLPTSISNILADTEVFRNVSANLPCISFQDLVDELADS